MSRASRGLFDQVPLVAVPIAAVPTSPAPPRQPSAAPRLDDDHLCAICGAPAGFGFGVFLRRGLAGRWSCLAHRDEVEAMAR